MSDKKAKTSEDDELEKGGDESVDADVLADAFGDSVSHDDDEVDQDLLLHDTDEEEEDTEAEWNSYDDRDSW